MVDEFNGIMRLDVRMDHSQVLGITLPSGFTVSDSVKVIEKEGVTGGSREVKEAVLNRERERRVGVVNKRRTLTRLGNRVRGDREKLNEQPTSWAPTIKPYRRGRD